VIRVSTKSATTAAARLTNDSRASDNNPTEPVRKYALDFIVMVTIAAAIDNQAYRVRGICFSVVFVVVPI
jgi:hypothetical protein